MKKIVNIEIFALYYNSAFKLLLVINIRFITINSLFIIIALLRLVIRSTTRTTTQRSLKLIEKTF